MSDLQGFVDGLVAQGRVPGAIAGRGRGDDVEIVAAGRTGPDGPPLATDAIVRIQSMTKPVSAVAALRLVAAGRIALDDAVDPWLPELADRVVLRHPDAPLDDVVPADRPMTLRDLLTCTSGYGSIFGESPLAQAMERTGTAAGPEPPALGADEWLARLARLPLVGQPGRVWRYHHSFSVLGVLLARVAGRPLGEHLAADLFEPLGMPDTGFWVPEDRLDRLPPAWRDVDGDLVEVEPGAAGFYAGPPPFDVSHGELVSTAADYLRFARVLAGDRPDVLPDHLLQELRTDQVPPSAKTSDSFFPGFWEGTGWGFGVAVVLDGAHRGEIGWAGGAGTDLVVRPDRTVAVLLTQLEMGERMAAVLDDFQGVV